MEMVCIGDGDVDDDETEAEAEDEDQKRKGDGDTSSLYHADSIEEIQRIIQLQTKTKDRLHIASLASLITSFPPYPSYKGANVL